MIVLRSPTAGNGRMRLIPPVERLPYAPRGVFRGDPFPQRMSGKESLALRQRHRMRRDTTNVIDRCSRARDKLHFDWQDGFCNNGELAFEKQVIDAHNRTREGVF